MSVWVSRSLMQCAFNVGLCTTEKMFHRELRRMNVPRETWPQFLGTRQANASTHFFERSDNGLAAIVCMPDDPKYSGIQKAAMLVHEAVHIWQAHRDSIGEKTPASEEEAYSIQALSQHLMTEFAEQTKK